MNDSAAVPEPPQPTPREAKPYDQAIHIDEEHQWSDEALDHLARDLGFTFKEQEDGKSYRELTEPVRVPTNVVLEAHAFLGMKMAEDGFKDELILRLSYKCVHCPDTHQDNYSFITGEQTATLFEKMAEVARQMADGGFQR